MLNYQRVVRHQSAETGTVADGSFLSRSAGKDMTWRETLILFELLASAIRVLDLQMWFRHDSDVISDDLAVDLQSIPVNQILGLLVDVVSYVDYVMYTTLDLCHYVPTNHFMGDVHG